ncbi:MAG TPA: alpha/beta fold hydrolase [Streptosporangiaceae bacterium]|nr:alpha/beta fold hydrolase [Streptosporangiaceae bacterium]
MVSYRQPGTVLTDLTFTVPLDHARPGGEQLELFAREVVAADKVAADLPWLLFLQGGPGFGAPRPAGRESWLDRALNDYRVLLLDQRGTGRSSPANRRTLARLGTAKAQAEYLSQFRADAIVADAELVRKELAGGRPWSVLGQSFGGFCTVSYLSRAPEGIREALITGGLPGLGASPDDVYRATYPLVMRKNAEHYARYPQDAARAKDIAMRLAAGDTRLPSGAPLTVEAFQSLGRMLGSSTGSHTLHYLLENAFAGGELSDDFLYQVESHVTFSSAPLYALVHEACYAQGGATGWSAQRVRAEFGEFDAAAALDGDGPLLFSGEMIYPWMFQYDPVLAPLAEAAEILARRDSWPPLYDADRLRSNDVPAAAAVYADDMYVPLEFSVPTARAIRGLRPWITNEYEHDGLRVSNGKVLDRLIAMVRGDA